MKWQPASPRVSGPRDSKMAALMSFRHNLKSHTPSFLKYPFITCQTYSIWEGIPQGIFSHEEITQWIQTGKNHEVPSWRLAATVHLLAPNDLYDLCYFQIPSHTQNAFPEAPQQVCPITISARNPGHLHVGEIQGRWSSSGLILCSFLFFF